MDEKAAFSAAELEAILERQRQAFLKEGVVTAATRRDRLTRLIDLVVDCQDELVDAMEADFGCRSRRVSRFVDIAVPLEFLKHARRHVRRWMRPERRRADFPANLFGARGTIHYQPLGVVGVMGPWNFPVMLSLGPLCSVVAAGNRVMLKPSEKTPATSQVIADQVAARFDMMEIAVVTGGPDVGQAFSRLPFDHLLFTGSTEVGRKVMSAAARNLVPVTLELGGKCPTVIGEGADLEKVAESVVRDNGLNAGQICLATDYLLIQEARREEWVKVFQQVVSRCFPTLLSNPDYGSIISEQHLQRLQGYLSDAREKGAQVIELNPAGEDFDNQNWNKIPFYLLLDVNDEMIVMQEEIFGPLIPVVTYRNFDDAIRYINARPRPLAVYFFGPDQREQNRLIERTTSGGVTLQDTLFHVAQKNLPFGGVGASGMGVYHAQEGFRQFSHAKPVFRQSGVRIDQLAGLQPPFGKGIDRLLKFLIRK